MTTTMTAKMNALIVQNFIKYLMKSNNWLISKSTKNYRTICVGGYKQKTQ